jgi:hypothetical protein
VILLSKVTETAIIWFVSAIAQPAEPRVRSPRRKTSFEVDFSKVDQVKLLLGTSSLTDTIDAALDEVIAIQKRQQLVALLFDGDALDLDKPEIMAAAWR